MLHCRSLDSPFLVHRIHAMMMATSTQTISMILIAQDGIYGGAFHPEDIVSNANTIAYIDPDLPDRESWEFAPYQWILAQYYETIKLDNESSLSLLPDYRDFY